MPDHDVATVVEGDFEWGDAKAASNLARRTAVSRVTRQQSHPDAEPVRVLGRGLRAQRGVHLPLRTLREAAGKTQADVAVASQIDQADVSRLEGRADFDDCQVSTLRRYLEGMGGGLELVAVFGNKKIVLVGVEAPSPSAKCPARRRPRRRSR